MWDCLWFSQLAGQSSTFPSVLNRITYQDGKKTFRVHKILDDLEYVAQNMGGATGGSGASSAAMVSAGACKIENIFLLSKMQFSYEIINISSSPNPNQETVGGFPGRM